MCACGVLNRRLASAGRVGLRSSRPRISTPSSNLWCRHRDPVAGSDEVAPLHGDDVGPCSDVMSPSGPVRRWRARGPSASSSWSDAQSCVAAARQSRTSARRWTRPKDTPPRGVRGYSRARRRMPRQEGTPCGSNTSASHRVCPDPRGRLRPSRQPFSKPGCRPVARGAM